MYNWRKCTKEQQEYILKLRRLDKRPWHSPPHTDGKGLFHITAANFNHSPIIGNKPERIACFEENLVITIESVSIHLHGWCVLPNHYHILVSVESLQGFTRELGKLHGRISRSWNIEDNTLGRKCWHCSADRFIRNEAHKLATLNYIHHNPVKHGYVDKWTEWPYSSATNFINSVGREKAKEIWEAYPVLKYGKGWDDF